MNGQFFLRHRLFPARQDGKAQDDAEAAVLRSVGDAAPQGAHDVLADHQAIAAVTGGGFDGFAQDGVALPQHQEALLHRRRKLHGLAGGAMLDDVGAYVVDQAHQQGDVGPHAEGPAGLVGVVQAEAIAGEKIVDAGGHLGQQLLAVVGIQRQGPAVLLEGEQVVGQTADVVGFFQGPVDEHRGALGAAGIALGQQLQIPDNHRQRSADVVGNGLDELLLLLELGVLRQQQQLDGVPQVVDVGGQGGQLRAAPDGDLAAEILAAQGGDVLLHLLDVPDVLLKQEIEPRHKGDQEQLGAYAPAQGGIGLVEIAAEIHLAGFVRQPEAIFIGGQDLGAPIEVLLVLLGIGHVIGHEGVVAQGLVLADDHQGDVVIPVVPLGEGLAVGADQVILIRKALQVLKMPVRQAAEHRRLRGIPLKEVGQRRVGSGVYGGADGHGQQDLQNDPGAEPVKQLSQCSTPFPMRFSEWWDACSPPQSCAGS